MANTPSWTDTDAAAARITDSGLKIHDLTPGTGAELKPGDTAEVHYTGWLLDGTQFDSSRPRNDTFVTRIPGQVIQGWNEGLIGMKAGGVRKLYIPAQLGYGSRGAGRSIPPNADLVFEIEMVDVT